MLDSNNYNRSFLKGNPCQYKYDFIADALCIICLNPNGLTKDLHDIIAKILEKEKYTKLRAILYRDYMWEWYSVNTESINSKLKWQKLGTHDITTAFYLGVSR